MSLWVPAVKSNPDDSKHGRITVTDAAGVFLREIDPDTSDRYDRPCHRHARRECGVCLLSRSYAARPAKTQPMTKLEGARS